MMDSLQIACEGRVKIYSSAKATWYFVALPEEDAKQIQFFTQGKRRGWGSVRVKAAIGDSVWSTSIFPDSKSSSYVLPVKAEIRKKEKIGNGDMVQFQLIIEC